jgi:DNA-binding NtrC family response regulator
MLVGNFYLLIGFFLLMNPEDKTPIVLVAEDEILVRQLSVCELEDAGYRVIEAASAYEALAIFEAGVPIDVLFTDVNMPGEIDGMGLAHLVHRRWPRVGLIVTSGRADVAEDELPGHGRFIHKPYRLSKMSEMVGQLARSH